MYFSPSWAHPKTSMSECADFQKHVWASVQTVSNFKVDGRKLFLNCVLNQLKIGLGWTYVVISLSSQIICTTW